MGQIVDLRFKEYRLVFVFFLIKHNAQREIENFVMDEMISAIIN